MKSIRKRFSGGRKNDDGGQSEHDIDSQVALQARFCKDILNVFTRGFKVNPVFKYSTTGTISINNKSSSVVELESLRNMSNTEERSRLSEIYKLLLDGSSSDNPSAHNQTMEVSQARMFALNKENEEPSLKVAISARLSPAMLEKGYSLTTDATKNLNYRERLLVCDLVFDRGQSYFVEQAKLEYIGSLPDDVAKPKVNELEATDSRLGPYMLDQRHLHEGTRVVGALLSDCLQDTELGLKSVGSFIPNVSFIDALESKSQCVKLMQDLIAAKDNATHPGKYEKVIATCYEINQGPGKPSEKMDMMLELLQNKAGELSRKTKRRLSEPSVRTSETKESPARSSSDPQPRTRSKSELKDDLTKIHAKYVHKSQILKASAAEKNKPSNTSGTMFQIKDMREREEAKTKQKEKQPTKRRPN